MRYTIGVVGDTHGDVAALRRVIAAAGEVSAWIHLGDNLRDSAELEKTGLPVFAISGNCDVFGQTEQVLGLYGARVFVTHGHNYGVGYSLDRLMYRAEEQGCSAALYGHTHVPQIDEDTNIFVMSPGSPSRPRNGSKPSYALLYIDDDGGVDGDLFGLV